MKFCFRNHPLKFWKKYKYFCRSKATQGTFKAVFPTGKLKRGLSYIVLWKLLVYARLGMLMLYLILNITDQAQSSKGPSIRLLLFGKKQQISQTHKNASNIILHKILYYCASKNEYKHHMHSFIVVILESLYVFKSQH